LSGEDVFEALGWRRVRGLKARSKGGEATLQAAALQRGRSRDGLRYGRPEACATNKNASYVGEVLRNFLEVKGLGFVNKF
jgi:hypothetical protein